MPGVQQHRQQVGGNVSVESRNLLVEEVADRIACGKIGCIGAGENVGEAALVHLAQLGLLASDLGIVHAGGGIAEDESTDAVGICRRETEHSPSTHRLAGERGAINPEVVEELPQIFDEGARTGAVGEVARGAKTAMIEGDAAKASREDRHVLPPREMVAAAAVGKYQRRAFAVRLVVEFDSIDARQWHIGLTRMNLAWSRSGEAARPYRGVLRVVLAR